MTIVLVSKEIFNIPSFFLFNQKAEEVALIKERLLNNYIISLPNYARSIDAAVSNLVSSVCNSKLISKCII